MYRVGLCAFLGGLSLTALLVLGTCRELTPEERINVIRSRYTAELTGFVVREEPEEGAVEGVDVASGEGAEAAAEVLEAEGVGTDELPLTSEVIFDILVAVEGTEKLPGITLDLSQVDSEREEKDHRLLWVDTSRVERGSGTQFTYVLDDISYEPGDGFHVEVRVPIPAEEQSLYREFGEQP